MSGSRSVARLVAPQYPPRTCLEPTCRKEFRPDFWTRMRCSPECYIKGWLRDGSMKRPAAEEALARIEAEKRASLTKLRRHLTEKAGRDNLSGGEEAVKRPKPAKRMSLEECNAFLIENGLETRDGLEHARWAVAQVRGESIPKLAPLMLRQEGETEMADQETATETKAPEKKKARKAAKKAKAKARRRAAGNGHGIIAGAYRDKYEVDRKHKTAGGNPSVSCGDNIAKALTGLDEDGLAKVARENKLGEKWSGWSKMNPGQKRMNLGNVLRGLVRKGEGATVGGKSVKTL